MKSWKLKLFFSVWVIIGDLGQTTVVENIAVVEEGCSHRYSFWSSQGKLGVSWWCLVLSALSNRNYVHFKLTRSGPDSVEKLLQLNEMHKIVTIAGILQLDEVLLIFATHHFPSVAKLGRTSSNMPSFVFQNHALFVHFQKLAHEIEACIRRVERMKIEPRTLAENIQQCNRVESRLQSTRMSLNFIF